MANRSTVPPVEEQDEEGVYFEEVGMIVDSVVDRIASGHLASKDACREPLEEAVGDASHVHNDDLCVRVLKWSHHPTAYFFENGPRSGQDPNHNSPTLPRTYERPWLAWDGGKATFPWRRLALAAMEADAKEELFGRPEFAALPQHDPEENADDGEEGDDENADEEDAGPEEAGEG